MKVKKLEKSERYDAYLVSAYCFHSRLDDPEKDREKIENGKTDIWGAINGDGKVVAKITNHRFKFLVDGKEVESGGIGSVATLPEYRDQGVIKDIFKELLKDAYKNGEVISTLYPFNQEFYRKQGYETLTYQNNYEFKPEVFAHYKFDGEIEMWNGIDDISDYLNIHNEYVKSYNMAMIRDYDCMLRHMKVDGVYKDRKFSYLFTLNGKKIAYLIFKDEYNNPSPIMDIRELAWINKDGFNAILSFLGKFSSDYGKIILPLPAGIDLLRIVRSRYSYGISKATKQDYMVRVINAYELLETIKKPDHCDFIIKVTDDIIEENNRYYHVLENDVEILKEAKADIEVSHQALGQMCVGGISLEEVALKKDVNIISKEEMLKEVFKEKKIFVREHF